MQYAAGHVVGASGTHGVGSYLSEGDTTNCPFEAFGEGFLCAGPPVASAEVYDPATDQWSPTGAMANARSSGPGVAPLADGRVLVEGSAVREEWCDSYGDCWRGPFHPTEIYKP